MTVVSLDWRAIANDPCVTPTSQVSAMSACSMLLGISQVNVNVTPTGQGTNERNLMNSSALSPVASVMAHLCSTDRNAWPMHIEIISGGVYARMAGKARIVPSTADHAVINVQMDVWGLPRRTVTHA